MKSRKIRRKLALGGALSFALCGVAGLAQVAGCAEGTQESIADGGSDVVRRPRPGEGGVGEGGVSCTATPCVIDIAAGGSSTCALIADGTVRCWGDNVAGELGSGGDGGTVTESATPLTVPGVSGALRVSAGGPFAASSTDYNVNCAGTSTGPLCWGSNEYGVLGRSALAIDSLPHPDPGVAGGFSADALVSLGQMHGCALVGDALSCWGSNVYQQLGGGLLDGGGPFTSPVTVTLPGGKKAVEIALGFGHTCALLDDKTVACWGYNGEYECGLVYSGSSYYQSTPYVVPGVSDAAHVTAGTYHTCVVTSAGKVQCWGYNYQGMLGNAADGGYATASPLDITMPGGKKAVQIAAGTETTCALLDDGTVACWGYNTYGQVGVPPDAGSGVVGTPAIVEGVEKAQQISMGAAGQHVCARLFGGGVKCWGANETGQLGASTSEAGSVGAMSATPVDVRF